MARKLLSTMLLIVFLAQSTLLCAALASSTPIRVTVNGRALTMDVPPVIRDGRTLVPLRAIFEALGATVGWEEATQTITGQRSGKTIVLRIGDTRARVGDAEVTLSVPPAVVNGRTMVPVRFIAESLGAVVNWHEATRTVEVVTEAGASAVRTMAAQIVSITDGDTVRVRLDTGVTENVRLIGVDTPESTSTVEPFGREATAFTTRHLAGQSVFLEIDATERDRFGRLLAYVWLSQPQTGNEAEVRAKMFNARLLLEGYANIMTIAPNVKYSEMFLKFEREARAANQGLWAVGQGQATTGVVINRVDLAGEEVVLKNTGTTAVDISNWTLVSVEGNQRFVFPRGTVIQAGGILTISSGPRATGGAGRLVWSTAHIWNNAGDPAILLNANNVEVSRKDQR